MTGTVNVFFEDKYFGFIVRVENRQGTPTRLSYFFHGSEWLTADCEPMAGQQVEFEVGLQKEGKPTPPAKHVRLIVVSAAPSDAAIASLAGTESSKAGA